MRGRCAGRAERAFRQPANIAVDGELTPSPAFTIRFIDGHALAPERLGQKQRIRPRRAAQRRLRLDHFAALALDKSCRLDLAFQIFGRQIGACRRDTGIEGWHGGGPLSRSEPRAARRAPAPPGTRRPPAVPAWPMASRRTRQNAATTWLSRTCA